MIYAYVITIVQVTAYVGVHIGVNVYIIDYPLCPVACVFWTRERHKLSLTFEVFRCISLLIIGSLFLFGTFCLSLSLSKMVQCYQSKPLPFYLWYMVTGLSGRE